MTEGWDYEGIPGYKSVLAESVRCLVEELGNMDDSEVADLQAIHLKMFRDLGGDNPCCCGNYRGSDFDGLRDLCMSGGEPPHRVCFAEPKTVAGRMIEFESSLKTALSDARKRRNIRKASSLLESAKEAALLFQEFIQIHPFANGNGHMGRFIVVAVLSRAGFYLTEWVDPRPTPLAYGEASIAAVSENDIIQLIQLIMRAVRVPHS